MIKNKKATYLLGVLVAVVWGLIIYYIFTSLNSDDDHAQVYAAPQTVKEAYNDYAILQDTAHLLLNYRNPFGVEKPKDTTKSVIPKLTAVKETIKRPLVPAMNWSFIKYSGYIGRAGDKKLIALLSINGKKVMLAEGEMAENVRLLKNLRDSVKISYTGKVKFISMHAATL